jgi:hypothetical protein
MLPTVFDQAKALKSLDGKPLAVLTADLGTQRGWFAAQDKLAQLSRNSAHRTVQGATHSALLEDQRFAAITSRAMPTWLEPPAREEPDEPLCRSSESGCAVIFRCPLWRLSSL